MSAQAATFDSVLEAALERVLDRRLRPLEEELKSNAVRRRVKK